MEDLSARSEPRKRGEDNVPSGERINTLVCTASLRGALGEIMEVMEMEGDEEEIRRLQDHLSSLNLLVGSISHAIKGQLTGMDGGIYLINSGNERNDPARVQKGWSMVQRNLDRIRSIVLHTLYYAKDREPLWDWVSAPDLLKDLEAAIEKKARECGVEFRVDVDQGLGNFEADPNALRSMLTNIIENFLEACRNAQDKERHFVRLSVSEDTGTMIFRIEDSGTAIDKETQDTVLGRFLTRKGIDGPRLGLFISNKIARSHGGTVQVDSTPGGGSYFLVRIPKRRAMRPEDAPEN